MLKSNSFSNDLWNSNKVHKILTYSEQSVIFAMSKVYCMSERAVCLPGFSSDIYRKSSKKPSGVYLQQ